MIFYCHEEAIKGNFSKKKKMLQKMIVILRFDCYVLFIIYNA